MRSLLRFGCGVSRNNTRTQEVGAPIQAELQAAQTKDKEALAMHLQTVDKVRASTISNGRVLRIGYWPLEPSGVSPVKPTSHSLGK